jgi:hypothetical protein
VRDRVGEELDASIKTKITQVEQGEPAGNAALSRYAELNTT